MWSQIFCPLRTFFILPNPYSSQEGVFLLALLLEPTPCVSALDRMSTCKVQISQCLWAISAFSNFSMNTKGCLWALVIVIPANSVLMASTFLLLHLNN